MNYIWREQWGARRPRRSRDITPSRMSKIFIHHTTGDAGNDSAKWIRSIQNFHMDSRGWSDIGYSWIVDRHGDAYVGRGWGIVGAHTQGHNSTAIGIAYLGDGDKPVAIEALRSIRRLCDDAHAIYRKDLKIGCHGDVGKTHCPGNVLRQWVRDGLPVDDPIGTPPPAPDPAPANRALLRRGSRGKDVEMLQARLGVRRDGIFGPQTEGAVRAFQRERRLVVDGIVGPNTWRELVALQ